MKQKTPEWLEFQKQKILKRKTIDVNGCWLWTGPVDKDGYGLFGAAKFFKAHRASYILFKDEIPLKAFVLHKCDIKGCFNPEHLYIGDAKQNAKDAVQRGQHPTGPNPKKALPHEKNGNSKLKLGQVVQIRELYGKPYSWAGLAKMFGISKRQIGRIVREESWKNI